MLPARNAGVRAASERRWVSPDGQHLDPIEAPSTETAVGSAFDRKSVGPVFVIDELQGVDRRVPFILGLLQGKLQQLCAAYAAGSGWHGNQAGTRCESR
jgi:hypothetical protein